MDPSADHGAFALPEHMLQAQQQEQGPRFILCCECGVQIPPNPSAMCVNCIRSKIDISEGIPKQGQIFFCRGCGRYLNPPNSWVNAELESRELLALCLKRLKGLNKVRLVDAGFVWTEPHSRRLKVKVTIQKEIYNGTVLEQVFVVEYMVGHQMCEQCHRREAQDTWNAVVQVRQKVRHKKTFFYLEQLIIKHNAHTDTTRIASRPDGIDFYYANKSHAKRMVDFLNAVVPIRYKTSQRLISHDIHNNTYNYKYTYSVEIVPVCKDDVVCLPPAMARHFGGMAQLAVCDRVGTIVHILDPFTLDHAEITAPVYWRTPFDAVASYNSMTEFTVIDMEPVCDERGAPIQRGKHALCEAIVARVRDFGVNDSQFTTRTHLGHILQPGDNVWGFDFTSANVNNDFFAKLKQQNVPEIILVKKSYSDKRKPNKSRKWKLKMLAKEEGLLRKDEKNAEERDYEAFLNDIEEDPEYRRDFNLYKNAARMDDTDSDMEDEDLKIGVDELLDDFDAMELDDGTVVA